MKTSVLAFAVLLAATAWAQDLEYVPPPCVPATQPNPNYPLHIHILGVNSRHNDWNYYGWGRANLLGDHPAGLEYTFTCGLRFMYNAQAEEFYQARWKKPHQKMEILMQEIGSKHLYKCDLEVTEKDRPYVLGPLTRPQ